MGEILRELTVNVDRNYFFTKRRSVWWDSNADFKSLLQFDSLCLDYIMNVLEEQKLTKGNAEFQLPGNLCILDVGCGGGILSEPLARAGANVLGIDINKSAVEAAQKHANLDSYLKNVEYRWESIEEHSTHNVQKYDIVILNFVLHHAKNHDTLLRDCVRTLKPGGIIFVATIGKTFEGWLRIKFLGETIFGHFPRGAFDWNDFINCSTVQIILNENDCHTRDVKGMYYELFSHAAKWNNNTNTFYIMHAIKQ